MIAAGTAGAKAADQPISLSITGAEGARYAGRCTLATSAGEQALQLEGVVPRQETFAGEGLTCRIEAVGRIAVEIARGGSRAVSVTGGGTLSIAVH